MEPIDVLMPLAPHHRLNINVVKAIDVSHRLHLMISVDESEEPNRIKRIVDARNTLLPRVTSDLFLCLDSDILLPAGVLSDALGFMRQCPEYGAVAIPVNYPHDMQGHPRVAAMMIRTKAIDGIVFRYTDSLCECRCLAIDLTRAGFPVLQWGKPVHSGSSWTGLPKSPPAKEIPRSPPDG